MNFDPNILIGNVYGDLEVLYHHHTESSERGGVHYMCYCHKCGNNVIFTYKQLTSHKYKDCGCSNSEFKPEYILNKKFGRLTPIKIKHKKGDIYYYDCICDCGNKLTLTNVDLIDNKREFCGCAAKEIFNFDSNISKSEFARLNGQKAMRYYYKTLYELKDKAAKLEANLTLDENNDIVGKDGRKYPIRWINNNKIQED